MFLSRRQFVEILSVSSLAPATTSWTQKPSRPLLKFGVVSDIHIGNLEGKDLGVFRSTLKWFDQQGVDAVVIAGDMADYGMIQQLLLVGKTWDEIFPNGKGVDGRPVEKVFVTGNHDWSGHIFMPQPKNLYPDVSERNRHALQPNIQKSWEQAFHESWTPFLVKEIKGYTFLGSHWGQGKYGSLLQDYLAKNGTKLDPQKPFFYVQHPHLKDTSYGPWAWGHDNGLATQVLSNYPNAFAFSGHSHYSLTDERTIWQGAFTTLGTSSLRYSCTTHEERAANPTFFENAAGIARARSSTVMSQVSGKQQQGLLVSVYADHITFARHSFPSNESLGSDWVTGIRVTDDKPYSFASRAQKAQSPQFPAHAQITLKKEVRTTPKVENYPAQKKGSISLTFPQAYPKKEARVYQYELVASNSKGEEKSFFAIANGYNFPLSAPEVTPTMTISIPCDRLPKDVNLFRIYPMNYWRTKGKPIQLKI